MCKKLTYLLTYYNQSFLKDQLDLWVSYPDNIISQIDILIVDDGSFTQRAYPIVKPYENKLPVKLLRVLKDIKWNQPGAINLGMCVANTNWVFHADIDNVVSAKSMNEIIQATQENKRYDFLFRVEDRTPLNPSAWLLTREMFWSIGGYDEDFCGNYGYDDSFFRYELERRGYLPMLLEYIEICWSGGGVVPDPKDCTINKQLLYDKVMSYKFNKPKRILRFPWRQLI